MQIKLRHFNRDDIYFISRKLYEGMTENEIICMIEESDSLCHKGVYFETFAIEADGELAGNISLYGAKEKGAVSVGLIIIKEYRGKGIGYEATLKILEYAKQSGYKRATADVLKNNLSSLRLCEKVQFKIIKLESTAKGEPIYRLVKHLQ